MRVVIALGGNALHGAVPGQPAGKMAAIGRLDDAEALLDGKAGTIVALADTGPP